MSLATTIEPAAPSPRGRGTPPPKHRQTRSTVGLAFDAVQRDPRLNPTDKVVLRRLADYCEADGNAICFPSTRGIAASAGIDTAEDGGEARVKRSLARLEKLGLIGRIAARDFAPWMAEVGRPKLNQSAPRTRSAPARFIVLWWKFPGVEPDYGSTRDRPPLAAPGALSDGCPRGANDRVDMPTRVKNDPPSNEFEV